MTYVEAEAYLAMLTVTARQEKKKQAKKKAWSTMK